MAQDRGAELWLPRGATGYFRAADGPLPQSDLRAFRGALYAEAREAGGRVGEFAEREYPRTFHTASVDHVEYGDEGSGCVVLCHLHLPWVAFTAERRDWYDDHFLDPPSWAHAFVEAGFTVPDRAWLRTPLASLHRSILASTEWRAARFYGVSVLGGVLFNSWD
ncbi:hypothetical protein [Streptomyces sp. NPDC047097]|uniref:hypothetical protein n=1 Tax=Streptomyces sp. NPDC047097 TaxID=3155260 RepID=UPI0033E79C57